MSFEDYVNAYYGGTLGISKRYGISKADDPLSTADTGYFNTMFGASVFNQLNTKSEIFKLLKKEAWESSGWRVLTGRGTTTAGVAEGGAFPETDTPDVAEVTATLKEVVTPWELTTKAELLADADDGIKGIASFLRKEQAEAHAYYIDAMLMQDGNTLAGNNFESLDRVCIDAVSAPAVGWGANDDDIYDVDRDTGTWHAATVSHASGSDRALTLAMLDAIIEGSLGNGVNYSDLILVTGYDSYNNLKQLLQTGTNNLWTASVGSGAGGNLNGVNGEGGVDFDTRVGAYDGIPIFLSQHVGKDTTSRIYLLDTANIAMRIAAPTTIVYNSNLAITQKLSKEMAFVTAGELIAYKFNTHGNIRDLNA